MRPPCAILFLVASLIRPLGASDTCGSDVLSAIGSGSAGYQVPSPRQAVSVHDAHGHEYYINHFGKTVPEPDLLKSTFDTPADATLFPFL